MTLVSEAVAGSPIAGVWRDNIGPLFGQALSEVGIFFRLSWLVYLLVTCHSLVSSDISIPRSSPGQ